jgi:hypothetical protein
MILQDIKSKLAIGSDKERFGFYQVGNFKTFSKMEAIELQQATGIHPHWNFNEEVFKAYDWTQEPPESLWELYTKRARQLREKYDYLVLNFSGGPDSHLMIRAFLENNIPFEDKLRWCFRLWWIHNLFAFVALCKKQKQQG